MQNELSTVFGAIQGSTTSAAGDATLSTDIGNLSTDLLTYGSSQTPANMQKAYSELEMVDVRESQDGVSSGEVSQGDSLFNDLMGVIAGSSAAASSAAPPPPPANPPPTPESYSNVKSAIDQMNTSFGGNDQVLDSDGGLLEGALDTYLKSGGQNAANSAGVITALSAYESQAASDGVSSGAISSLTATVSANM